MVFTVVYVAFIDRNSALLSYDMDAAHVDSSGVTRLISFSMKPSNDLRDNVMYAEGLVTISLNNLRGQLSANKGGMTFFIAITFFMISPGFSG